MALRDRRGAALAFFALLTLAHTWPLVTAPAALSRIDSADGLLNQWILGWVAHALVTTVRRRRHDLAIMRSFGFTARQSRVAIAWQATLLAVAGVIVGVPLGIVAGRTIWRWLADEYPVVYTPPIEVVAVLLVVPAALLVVNAIAVAPGRAAARIRPAEALRVE